MADSFLGRMKKGKMGTKTLLGLGIMTLAVGAEFFGLVETESFQMIIRVGEIITGIGLRDAISKVT